MASVVGVGSEPGEFDRVGVVVGVRHEDLPVGDLVEWQCDSHIDGAPGEFSGVDFVGQSGEFGVLFGVTRIGKSPSSMVAHSIDLGRSWVSRNSARADWIAAKGSLLSSGSRAATRQ